MVNIGHQIYIERKARRVQQAALAEAMGLHVGTLIDVELGRLPVGMDVYENAIKAMDAIKSKEAA